MRMSVFALVLVLGCGDDSGGSGAPDGSLGDAPRSDGALGSLDAGGADGPRADAGSPPSCGGLARDACEATAGCAPACVSLCDCTCPGPPGGHEGCGCDGCAPSCFTYDACVSTFGFTPCGDDWCDPVEDVCVTRTGGIGIFSLCEKVPNGCLDDRTCPCLGEELCGGGPPAVTCTADPEANTVRCDCPMCA